VVILDEAQNTTSQQIKMFLTRLGMNSKIIVTGDMSQIDLPSNQRSGLVDALGVLKRVKGIGRIEFCASDIVRHPLVQRIVEAYDKSDAARKAAKRDEVETPEEKSERRKTPRTPKKEVK
jgi:phosphate starvation-inducible PhoH-like protein